MKKTSFDVHLEKELLEPGFRAQFESELELIKEIDRLVSLLDATRISSAISKKELADRIGVTDSQVRRLFSSADKNPTLKSFLSLVAALGLEVQLVSSSESNRISA